MPLSRASIKRRSQLGQQAHLVVDRPSIAHQGILLADFRAAKHAADSAVKQGDGIVGQARDRVEYRRDQSRATAQRRQSPQMLRGKAGTLARKLAQAFRVNAVGASRIDGDCGEHAALLHQTREGAMTGSAGRLTCPSQPADRCASLGRQQSI